MKVCMFFYSADELEEYEYGPVTAHLPALPREGEKLHFDAEGLNGFFRVGTITHELHHDSCDIFVTLICEGEYPVDFSKWEGVGDLEDSLNRMYGDGR